MPSDKKGGHSQNRQNGGMREQAWQAGQQIREGAENVANRIQSGVDSAREGVSQGYRQMEGTISRYPAPSVLISFGVGFGLGIVLCQLLERDEDSWAERNFVGPFRRGSHAVRDSMRHVPDHVHHLAEAIAGHLPDAIKRRVS
jgi:hypothetical protein